MFSAASGMSNTGTPLTACHLGLSSGDQVLEEVLVEHPIYLQRFVEMLGCLMDGDEPLSIEERNYIGLMAACRHKCTVLVSEQRERFTSSLGPSRWLEGLHQAPNRLRSLHTANAVLAHRPWLFSKTHVKELVKSGLSLSEVVHALTILAHYHAMAGMLHALGIEASTGTSSLPYQTPPDPGVDVAGSSPLSSELSQGGVKVLLERMQGIEGSDGRALESEEPATACPSSSSNSSFDPGYSSGLPAVDFETDDSALDKNEDEKRFSIFSPDMNFMYQDFYRRGGKSEAPTLKFQHLLEEIGFSMLEKFTSQDLALSIDNKCKTGYTMTYNTCGSESGVNTTPFRIAIWNYTQSLFGIRRDDYDYRAVNQLLDRHLKVFLKTMSVAPERLVTGDSHATGLINDLRPSEQVHIVILATEARLQAEMLYAMLAVERYYM